MQKFDVILIHPPAVYDFRKKAIFPGALGSSVEAVQYTRVPIGMLSLAEYLERHGYSVRIENLADRMVYEKDLDVDKHLGNISAGVFAIGLHFQWHAQGALEIARLCKKLHPGSPVILGGLTATRFHEEIIRKYEFVDAVIRAEAEKPFVQFMQALEKYGKLSSTPNLTYRTESGEICTAPLMPASSTLDDFEYTRFDLMEPKTSVFIPDSVPRWSLEVCRGCAYNCSICGGSAYTYKTYLGMDRPALRSPSKIIGDIRKLNEQGIRFIGLFQDPRMGGKDYCRELMTALRDNSLDIERLSLDLLAPADEEFIQEISLLGRQTMVHICPDTGCDAVRRKLGRHYTTDELLKTVNLCHKYLVPVTSFFSVGLAGETPENVNETWELWETLSNSEQIALLRGRSLGIGGPSAQGGPILGPIVLDPGSLAFDYPEKYGYKLLYRNLEEYIQGLSQPSWHQWLNYETDLLDNKSIIEIILQSTAFTIEQREAAGVFNKAEAEGERRRLKADIVAVNEVDRIMKIENAEDREKALQNLRAKYNEFLGRKE